MIGPYGTGKSAFLWAFEQQVNGGSHYFSKNTDLFNGVNNFENPVIYLSLKGLDAIDSITMKKSIRDYLRLLVFDYSYAKEKMSAFLNNEFDKYLNEIGILKQKTERTE